MSSYKDLITYVADRRGHDKRYAIDASKIQRSSTFNLGYKWRDYSDVANEVSA